MSQLTVKNNLLEYKGTSYNIHQISTIQIVEIKGKNSISFKFLKYMVPFSIIFLGISYFMLSSSSIMNSYYNYAFGIGGLGVLFVALTIKKLYKNIHNKFFYIYGLDFKMANGENPVFIASSKRKLFEIKDGIHKAINKENESINFGNVNIEIADSSHVEIGNIVKR
jgi:hypothetical protein